MTASNAMQADLSPRGHGFGTAPVFLATIGISLYLSQAISVAFYMVAFAEVFRPLFSLAEGYLGFPVDPRMISLPAPLLLVVLMLTKGADLGVKALWAVAQIISMFFMVPYGALCTISFLQHFAANPSYRPSFRSKWYLSLLGAVMCFMMMFQMQPLYAVLSLVVLALIYLWVSATHRGARGLAAIFQGTMFQLIRWLQVQLQKNQTSRQVHDWRPSFIAISRHSVERLAPFEVLKWISHRYGFGTLIHFCEGYLSRERNEEVRHTLSRLISRAEASGAGIYIDSMVSPSFTTALAQTIQLPGISGLENNSVLFEFAADRPEEIEEVAKGCQLAGGLGFNACVLRSTERHFGYRRDLHVWLTRYDDANANLMILLAYIIMGHPDWEDADLTIFAIFPGERLQEEVTELKTRIASGRLPISALSVRALPADDELGLDRLVAEHSRDADLLMVGYSLELLQHAGEEAFGRYAGANDTLFVNANQEVAIS